VAEGPGAAAWAGAAAGTNYVFSVAAEAGNFVFSVSVCAVEAVEAAAGTNYVFSAAAEEAPSCACRRLFQRVRRWSWGPMT